MEKHQIPVLEDVLHRIDRLNKLVHQHEEQAKPDILAIEGYQKASHAQYRNFDAVR